MLTILLINGLIHLKAKAHLICRYEIMARHVHALIEFMKTNQLISSIIGNRKTFMAYEIVSRLTKQNDREILLQLERGVNITDCSLGKLHQMGILGATCQTAGTEVVAELSRLIFI